MHPHIERRGDRTFFFIAADMQVAIGAPVGQPVNQPGVAMKTEDDMLSLCEQRVIILIGQSVRMLCAGLQFHQIDYVDHSNLKLWQMLAQDGDRGQDFERRRIPATAHDHVRLPALVITRPLPDADALRAMHRRGIHGEPLRKGVFAGYHDIDVIPAAQAVIEDRQQTIGIGRQIHADDIGLFVDDVIEKTGVLMCEAVVILLPHVRGE